MTQISVVIPVFNGERFIAEAIQSVFDQSYQPHEIIVVDDGSTDGTSEIVRQMSGSVPIAYYRQENQGAGTARNRGVAVAQGEWVAFLDADDVWCSEKLAVQMQHLLTHPDVAFFYSEIEFINEMGQFKPPKPRSKPGWQRLIFTDTLFPIPSTVLLRKDLFAQAGGFNPLLRCYEDFELWARLIEVTPIYFIPLRLVKYRRHPTKTSKNKLLVLNSWPIVHQLLWERWELQPEKRTLLQRELSRYHEECCKYYLRNGRFHDAQRFARLAFHSRRSLKNLRRLTVSYLPGVRNLYYGLRSRV